MPPTKLVAVFPCPTLNLVYSLIKIWPYSQPSVFTDQDMGLSNR